MKNFLRNHRELDAADVVTGYYAGEPMGEERGAGGAAEGMEGGGILAYYCIEDCPEEKILT